MSVQHKSLREEILFVLGRASEPLDSSQIYERCQLADEMKQVSNAIFQLKDLGKIAAAEGDGRKRYVLAHGVSASAPAGKAGRPPEAPVAGFQPAPEPALPKIDIPTLGAPDHVADAHLADAIIASSREQLAPGLEGGPQWWIDQDGCLEIADRGDTTMLVEFTRDQARRMAEMILSTHVVLEEFR